MDHKIFKISTYQIGLFVIDSNSIFVTGGYGLVGSCVRGGHKPRSSEVNLLDFKQTLEYMQDNNIKNVVHCAAKVGGVQENMDKLGEFFYENMQMTLNIIEASRLCGVEKMVCLLSTCIFPDTATYPLTTDQIHMGEPHPSNYGYGYAKRMTEINARSYRDQYGMKIVNVVPCNVYGIGDNYNLTASHVIPGLIHKCYIAKQYDSDLEVWGDGLALREFIYNKDLGKIIDWALENYDDDEALIVSPDQERTIAEAVTEITKAFDFYGNVKYDSSKPKGQHRKPSDNSKFKSLVPNFEFTSLETGIKETVDWFENNYESVRK